MGLFRKFKDVICKNSPKGRNKEIPIKSYKDGKYRISEHAASRMNDRKITKGQVHINLHTSPIKITEVKTDNKGRKSYERYSQNLINTRINPDTNNVNTVSKYHSKLLKKFKKERK